MAQRITLADLAEKTGLNISTVSRALTRPGRVSAETRRLVEKVAADLGYMGNIAARNLSRGTTETIMVLAPNFTGQAISPVFTEVLLGVCDEAESLGLSVMIHSHTGQPIPTADVMRFLHNHTVDGILLIATEKWDRAVAGHKDGPAPPVISVMHDLTSEGLSSVVAQEEEGFVAVVDHLAGLGHRSFAYIAGLPGVYHEVRRYAAVRDRLTALGLQDGLVPIEGGPFDLASGFAAAGRFLALDQRPTAAICCCDALAIGFMQGVRQAGLSVPDDVAVAGYDGLDYTAFITPALTTAVQPSAEIGRAGVRMLDDFLKGRITAPRLVSLAPRLAVRESA
ncbi:LacI family DNA-binding transcriptional regulator [Acetobacter musti]|uniref:LacI family DNA-binding transcriptional regulator n=1 Tax=Acetobacter musti TaxID=864732 RepID=A0ABX0JSQ4_9PROT|nr:LacI family DNA-binding transcriptional regulator [Acetobacter musti]